MRALVVPFHDGLQVFLIVAQRLVDEHRKARLDERAAPFHMLRADIRRADHRVDVPEHFQRIRADVRDAGRPGAVFRHGAVFVAGEAHVRDVRARDAEGLRRLLAEIIRDRRIQFMRPFVHDVFVVTVVHRAPGKRMRIALGHAENADAKLFVAERELICHNIASVIFSVIPRPQDP